MQKKGIVMGFDYENAIIDKDQIPEKRLWCAVVRQALEDYQRINPFFNKINLPPSQERASKKIENTRNTARHWLFISQENGIGSLFWICENLKLDINYIRKIAKTGILFEDCFFNSNL